MIGTRHGTATVEFPSEREMLLTRRFDAPAVLVFEALTKQEHVRHWFGAGEMPVCEVDLRVGGNYHYVCYVVEGDQKTCSFRGTFREISPPDRLVATWSFDGWPGVEAVETVTLSEEDGVTTMTDLLTFADQAGRDSATWVAEDGIHADRGGQVGWDRLEDYLASLLEHRG